MRVASPSWLCDHLHVETRGVIRSGTGALVALGPDDLTLKECVVFISVFPFFDIYLNSKQHGV